MMMHSWSREVWCTQGVDRWTAVRSAFSTLNTRLGACSDAGASGAHVVVDVGSPASAAPAPAPPVVVAPSSAGGGQVVVIVVSGGPVVVASGARATPVVVTSTAAFPPGRRWSRLRVVVTAPSSSRTTAWVGVFSGVGDGLARKAMPWRPSPRRLSRTTSTDFGFFNFPNLRGPLVSSQTRRSPAAGVSPAKVCSRVSLSMVTRRLCDTVARMVAAEPRGAPSTIPIRASSANLVVYCIISKGTQG
mmetsp:Transcript_23135/g.56249  ORF Transcript_23135/g.56249 Transcript_23135/m.56249 type:complete len:246 (+) Transcript_23135:873-1610(+)